MALSTERSVETTQSWGGSWEGQPGWSRDEGSALPASDQRASTNGERHSPAPAHWPPGGQATGHDHPLRGRNAERRGRRQPQIRKLDRGRPAPAERGRAGAILAPDGWSGGRGSGSGAVRSVASCSRRGRADDGRGAGSEAPPPSSPERAVVVLSTCPTGPTGRARPDEPPHLPPPAGRPTGTGSRRPWRAAPACPC